MSVTCLLVDQSLLGKATIMMMKIIGLLVRRFAGCRAARWNF
jgi:hypothetical protein